MPDPLAIWTDVPGRLLVLQEPDFQAPKRQRFVDAIRRMRRRLPQRGAVGAYAAGELHRLALDRSSGKLAVVCSRKRGWSRGEIEIPLDAISKIRVRMDAAQQGVRPLTLHVRFGRGREEQTISMPFRVTDLDAFEEAQDLVFRLGHVAGLERYRLRETSTVREIELVRAEQASSNDSPYRQTPPRGPGDAIPGLEGPARYEEARRPFTEPDPPVEPFVPRLGERAIPRWEPGKKVELMVRRPADLGDVVVWILWGLFWAAVFAFMVVAAWTITMIVATIVLLIVGVEKDPFWFAVVVGGLFALLAALGLVLCFVFPDPDDPLTGEFRPKPREIAIRWDDKSDGKAGEVILVDTGRRIPFSEICAVRVEPDRSVLLDVIGDDITIYTAPSETLDPDSPRGYAVRLAASLARDLDVHCDDRTGTIGVTPS